MPIYEWQHEGCDHVQKELNKMADHDKKPEKCEKCGYEGEDWKRIIGSVNFALKGGGWYRDGYS